MKTWQKYLFIYIPIGFFCCLINFCAKKDNRAPYVEYHLLHELDKTEYSVNDLVTGKNLGKINFSIDNDEVIFDISAEAVSGTLMIGEYGIISRKSGQKIQKIANLQYYKSKANYGTKKKGISR